MNSGIRSRAQRDTGDKFLLSFITTILWNIIRVAHITVNWLWLGYSHETAKPRFVHRRTHDAFTTISQLPPAVVTRVRKRDPCEYVNLKLPGDHITLVEKYGRFCWIRSTIVIILTSTFLYRLASTYFRGKQSPQTADQRLSRITVGQKELTGFSTNNGGYVDKPSDQSRFISHYEGKFGPKQGTISNTGSTWIWN